MLGGKTQRKKEGEDLRWEVEERGRDEPKEVKLDD
jgi:hypothetical protein